MTTFLYTSTGATRKQKERKKFSLLKCIQKLNVIKKEIWVLVFSFMYLVLVDVMDRSYNYKFEFSALDIWWNQRDQQRTWDFWVHYSTWVLGRGGNNGSIKTHEIFGSLFLTRTITYSVSHFIRDKSIFKNLLEKS